MLSLMNRLRNRVQSWIAWYWESFSFVGLVVATLFFAVSVTPSLLPRVYVVQGVLSGFSLAIGYGVGVALVWGWQFLELPRPTQKIEYWAKRITTLLAVSIFLVFVRQDAEWQNSIRRLMDMPPLESADPYRFFLIAILIASMIVAFVRLMIRSVQRTSRRLERYVPRRISIGVSTLLVVTLAFLVSNDLIAANLLNVADRFFLNADSLIDSGIEQPTRAMSCGSVDSLVTWDSIGRRGKNFISGGPSSDTIAAFTGGICKEPIRVYVGMRSEDLDDVARAELALEELKRVGGFERKVLIVATPTGTGWLDEGAVDTIEYLHRGDTAIVSTQYSYLPSWLTILVDPERSIGSAQLLFDRVYDHWKTLPKDARPSLFLFGLSLGSLGCEEAADLLQTFEDPIQGAVWSGPPFPSKQWATVVRTREPESPVWMPRYRDDSMIRFTAQENHLETGERWGPIRNVYIQHASDPMVWFSPSLAWRRPEWLNDPRGPDVSQRLRWFPIVTFLQVGFDLPLATSVPIGFGHNYSPSSYIDAWVAVTQPTDWPATEIDRLKRRFQDLP